MAESTDPRTLLITIEAGTAPVVVDVRSRLEFASGHVPSAVHVPFWLLPWRWRGIPARPRDPVVVYCGHGPRAWFAARVLRRRGFARVTLLRGHYRRWVADGLPAQRGQ